MTRPKLKTIQNGPIDGCSGLRFVNGRWVRRFKNELGQMKQYTFARYPETSEEQARAYVDKYRGQSDPLLRYIGVPTIGMMVDVYLEEYVKTTRQAQSYLNARSSMLRNLKPIMTMSLDDVTAAVLHQLILQVKKRAPTMAHSLRSELKQAWSYALSIGMTEVSCPVTSMTGGRFTKKARDRILSDDEVRQLLTPGWCSQRLHDVITICLYTGLRSGEVVNLRSGWVNYREQNPIRSKEYQSWLAIPSDYMKNGMEHMTPLYGAAEKVLILRDNTNDDWLDWLFPNKRKTGPSTQAALSREVHKLKGPVKNWRLHDLRRTARTTLQRLGCPFEVSEAILAHKLPGVSSVYARYHYWEEKQHWIKRLANHYEQLLSS